MQREILKADGTTAPLPTPTTIADINKALEEAIPFTLCLPDGLVMMGDDNGIAKGLPVNEAATKLYHSVCRPGTTNKVYSDVVVVFDADFGDDF